jgi:hypothetical protein
MQFEANLLEPPRITIRRHRSGEQSIGGVIDGLTEARDIFAGTIRAFSRKLAGASSYDGLPEFIRRVYASVSENHEVPITIEEIGESVELIERLSKGIELA